MCRENYRKCNFAAFSNLLVLLPREPEYRSWYNDKLRCGRSAVRNPVGTRNFSLLQNHSDLLRGPPILIFNGHRLSFPGVNWPESEAGRSPPSNAEVKNKWSSTFFPSIRLRGVDRGNFILRINGT